MVLPGIDLPGTLELAVLAVAIEAVLGYPQALFRAMGHPVTWAGRLIACFDMRLNQSQWPFAARRALGFAALALLLLAAGSGAQLVALGIVALGIPPLGTQVLAALIASSLIAQRSLDAHVLAVAKALDTGLEQGREAVARIAGRDVKRLDEAGIARAAIESLAENFSDGVVAPAFWLALGGLPGGMCYKAINTADSMIGHRTQRHAAFGFAAAKLDDLANFFPARLSALWLAIAACAVPGASPGGAWRAVWRDARGHVSPNAGWPEAAAAGALGLRLGGPRSYDDTVIHSPVIGSGKDASAHDIRRALSLYHWASAIHWLALAVTAFAIAQA